MRTRAAESELESESESPESWIFGRPESESESWVFGRPESESKGFWDGRSRSRSLLIPERLRLQALFNVRYSVRFLIFFRKAI